MSDVPFKLTVCDSLLLFICFTENLALNKPTWQNSTFWPHTGSDRAVDGQYTDHRWLAGQCAVSDLGLRTVEWRGGLGGGKNIHHVFLQFATDNNVWGTLSYNLIHSFYVNQMYYI